MAASPADLLSDLAHLWGGTVRPGCVAQAARSYDSTGQGYSFVPAPHASEARYALDVELVDQPFDPDLTDRLSQIADTSAPITWSRLEVAAKLLDIPVHLCLREALHDALAWQKRCAALEITSVTVGALHIALGRLITPEQGRA